VYLARRYGRTRYLRCCHPRTATVNYVSQRTRSCPGCVTIRVVQPCSLIAAANRAV